RVCVCVFVETNLHPIMVIFGVMLTLEKCSKSFKLSNSIVCQPRKPCTVGTSKRFSTVPPSAVNSSPVSVCVSVCVCLAYLGRHEKHQRQQHQRGQQKDQLFPDAQKFPRLSPQTLHASVLPLL